MNRVHTEWNLARKLRLRSDLSRFFVTLIIVYDVNAEEGCINACLCLF